MVKKPKITYTEKIGAKERRWARSVVIIERNRYNRAYMVWLKVGVQSFKILAGPYKRDADFSAKMLKQAIARLLAAAQA